MIQMSQGSQNLQFPLNNQISQILQTPIVPQDSQMSQIQQAQTITHNLKASQALQNSQNNQVNQNAQSSQIFSNNSHPNFHFGAFNTSPQNIQVMQGLKDKDILFYNNMPNQVRLLENEIVQKSLLLKVIYKKELKDKLPKNTIDIDKVQPINLHIHRNNSPLMLLQHGQNHLLSPPLIPEKKIRLVHNTKNENSNGKENINLQEECFAQKPIANINNNKFISKIKEKTKEIIFKKSNLPQQYHTNGDNKQIKTRSPSLIAQTNVPVNFSVLRKSKNSINIGIKK